MQQIHSISVTKKDVNMQDLFKSKCFESCDDYKLSPIPGDRICILPYNGKSPNNYDMRNDCLNTPVPKFTGLYKDSGSDLHYWIDVLRPEYIIDIPPQFNTFSDIYMMAILESKKIYRTHNSTINNTLSDHLFNGTFLKYTNVWFYLSESIYSQD